MDEINYIADFSVPNKSAYAVHVFKICDSFAKRKKLNSIYIQMKIIFPSKKYSKSL